MHTLNAETAKNLFRGSVLIGIDGNVVFEKLLSLAAIELRDRRQFLLNQAGQ